MGKTFESQVLFAVPEEVRFQSRSGVIFSEDKVGGTVDGLIVGGAQVCSRRLQLDSPRRLIKLSGW